jgi:hypothetical protein
MLAASRLAARAGAAPALAARAASTLASPGPAAAAPTPSSAAPGGGFPFVIRDLRRGIDARGGGGGAGLKVPRPPKKPARAAAHLAARVASVTAALAGQDKKRADYRKTLPARAPRSGLLQYIKKNAWEKDE